MTPSTCCGVAPSSSKKPASRVYWCSMRLPMKPSQLPATTPTFFNCFATASALAIVSGDVFAPRTISSNFITLAGLKKCIPTTSCGRAVTPAIASTSSVDVFVARIVPGFAIASSLRNTSCLTPISSNTASMTRSTSAAASSDVANVMRAMRASISSCDSLPLRAVAA